MPAVICSMELRRHLRSLLSRHGLPVAVLSHGEIAPEFMVKVVGTLRPPRTGIVRPLVEAPHLTPVAA